MSLPLFDDLKAIVTGRALSYRLSLGSKEGEQALRDLARFCHAHESTTHPNARAQAMLEGRREVWLRIEKYLNLSPEQSWELYKRENNIQS